MAKTKARPLTQFERWNVKSPRLRRGLLKELDDVFEGARVMCGALSPDDIAPEMERIGRLRREVKRLLREGRAR